MLLSYLADLIIPWTIPLLGWWALFSVPVIWAAETLVLRLFKWCGVRLSSAVVWAFHCIYAVFPLHWCAFSVVADMILVFLSRDGWFSGPPQNTTTKADLRAEVVAGLLKNHPVMA